jgi:S-DNA-T family DNA segregation ATPase FtsK/SpoIIIE
MTAFEKHKADIARAVEAKGEIRILAPIPGTSLVGIEVPTETRTSVQLGKEHLRMGTLSLPIGQTVHGEVIYSKLNEMPHLLIAGATGAGKSVLLHTIITAITKQIKPDELKLILIDPKRVELSAFAKLKHLHGGKITYEYGPAIMILKGLIQEMEERYKMLEKVGKRDITEYNGIAGAKGIEKLPYIVLVIDEFGDLILQGKAFERKKKKERSLGNIVNRAQTEVMARQMAKMGLKYRPSIEDEDEMTVEEMIARLAAMARAVGIHLIISTQRPSIDVVTGLIKANFPTRIALTTSSATDSKVILGEEGAEKLTGKGDLLFMSPGANGRQRLQGFMI